MILDHLGRPLKQGPLKSSLPRGSHYARTVTGASRVNTELTPERVGSILAEADRGRPQAFQDMMDRIEDRDPHYWSVLQSRRAYVAEKPLVITPADSSKKARVAADFCSDVLKNIPNLEAELLALLGAVTRGYMLAEITWDRNEWVPMGLRRWEPRLFVRSPEDPHALNLLTEKYPNTGEALEPGQWLCLVHRAKSGLPVRAGLGRIIAWYHCFKQFSIKDWLAFSELFGTPPRIGRYDNTIGPDDLAVLNRAVRGLGQDLAAILPKGTDIEFPELGSKTASVDLYKDMASFCNAEMSKAVVGGTLTSEQGDTGSYSLGQVHERSLHSLGNSDARALAGAIQQQLLRPALLWNLGDGHPLPKVSFDLTDPAALLKQVKELAEVGLPISTAWLYERFGIPAPTKSEQTIGTVNLRDGGGHVELAGKKKALDLYC